MKYLLSLDLIAVVATLATSDPASGSVIAMQILFRPRKRSGENRFWSSGLPNFNIGGRPNAYPMVIAPVGPLVPIRAICLLTSVDLLN